MRQFHFEDDQWNLSHEQGMTTTYDCIDRLLLEKVNTYLSDECNDEEDDISISNALVFYRSQTNRDTRSSNTSNALSLYYSLLLKLSSSKLKLDYEEYGENVSNNASHPHRAKAHLCSDLLESLGLTWFSQDISNPEMLCMEEWAVIHRLFAAISPVKSEKVFASVVNLCRLILNRAIHMITFIEDCDIVPLHSLMQCHIICLFRDLVIVIQNVNIIVMF